MADSNATPNIIQQQNDATLSEASDNNNYWLLWVPAAASTIGGGLRRVLGSTAKSALGGGASSGIAVAPITVVAPSVGDKFGLIYTKVSLTVTQITSVSVGTSPSVTFSVRYGTDMSGSGTEVKTGGITTTSTTTGDITTSFDSASIPANRFVWVTVSANSGVITNTHISVNF